MQEEMKAEIEKKKHYKYLYNLKCRKELDDQTRRSTIKKRQEELEAKEKDLWIVKDQVVYTRQQYDREVEMEKKQRDYQKECAEYNITQGTKRLQREQAIIEREKKLFNETNSMMLEKDKIKKKELLEEKLRIANTLASVYKQQEHAKRMRKGIDDSFPTQKITEVPFDQLHYLPELTSKTLESPSRNCTVHIVKTEPHATCISNQYEPPQQDYHTSLHRIDAISNQRMTNAYRHQSKRLFTKSNLYAEPNPLQYNKNEKYAGLRGVRFGYNIITGQGPNPQSLLDNGNYLIHIPDFLRNKIYPEQATFKLKGAKYPYITKLSVNNTYG